MGFSVPASTTDDLILLTDSFRYWLLNKSYSSSTVRNYLVDINKFLNSSLVSSLPQPLSLNLLLSSDTLLSYLSRITGQNNYRRQLASLNQFCHFAVDQQLVPQNYLKSAVKKLKRSPSKPAITLDTLLKDFENSLIKQDKTPLTIKNYINDLHQFINWALKNHL